MIQVTLHQDGILTGDMLEQNQSQGQKMNLDKRPVTREVYSQVEKMKIGGKLKKKDRQVHQMMNLIEMIRKKSD